MEDKTLPNERELFGRMAAGDERAFAQIFYHYSQRIFGFVLAKTKSEATTEEIVQEVFATLWHKRELLKDVENYEGYVFTMATNKVFDFLRKMVSEEKLKRKVWSSLQLYSNVTEETLDLNQSKELLEEAIQKLPPQRKTVFLLSRREGLSHQEIAERLNLSPKTVNNHLTEALRFVKEYLRRSAGTSLALLLILLRIKNH